MRAREKGFKVKENNLHCRLRQDLEKKDQYIKLKQKIHR
jgi:hypothetical protein